MPKLTLSGVFSINEVERKSRFIATAAPAVTVDEANAFFEKVRDPAATHNCWAYLVDSQVRFSDDGEVPGTAGKPILGAIEKQGLNHVAIMVTRHFGGIKLGMGGLIRAYGGTAARCLQAAPKKNILIHEDAHVLVPFRALGKILDILRKERVEILEKTQGSGGITLHLRFEKSMETFLKSLFQEIPREKKGHRNLLE